MKRLPKGYGSVYKLSGNRRKPFAARINLGKDVSGKTNYLYLGYYATRQEALQALADSHSNDVNMKMYNATLNDIWEIFKKRRFDKISASTQAVYKAAYKNLSALWDMPVKDVKSFMLQEIIDDMNKSWQAKSHVQTLAKQLFDIAIDLDVATKNPAQFVDLGPKIKSTLHKAFTASEIKLLFKTVGTDKDLYGLTFTALIMIYTGLRPAEFLSIKTEDIHLEEHYFRGGVKTKAGINRVVPIADIIYPYFVANYNPQHKLFFSMSKSMYLSKFKELMQSLGMDHLPDDGRHTFATLADYADINPLTVKLIMGHAIDDLTKGVYTHKNLDDLLDAVNLLA